MTSHRAYEARAMTAPRQASWLQVFWWSDGLDAQHERGNIIGRLCPHAKVS